MQTIITILLTVLLFGVLIFIHELGHFLTAKWSQIKVDEFSLGMGPAIFKKQYKETLYSLRLFPIGGFVKMDGEDGDGVDENSFDKKPKWKRFIVLVAGAFNNLVFGFLIICIVYGCMSGLKYYPTTTIDQFHKDAVSVDYGLKEQDEIYSINGYRIYTYSDIGYACGKDSGTPLDFVVLRNGERVKVNGVRLPIEKTSYAGDLYAIDFYVNPSQKTLLSTIRFSFDNTISLSRSIYSFIGSLFTGKANINHVSGVVGTTQVISKTVSTESGIDFSSLFLMMAMISINLGIVNLLPFPALDGGRVLLLCIEAVFRKKLNPNFEMIINFLGFALLILLMIVVTIKDVINLF